MPTVLIVDDHEEALDLLESVLREQRYHVVKARNGLEALDSARRSPPDLVIADSLMPVMDGFTLCWRWRTDDRLRPIPFAIHATPCADLQDEHLALRMGADRFLPKPVDPQALLETVRELLSQPRPNRPRPTGDAMRPGGTVTLKEYDENLIRRLESRLAELEAANRILRAREECLDSILNTIPDAILTFSEAGVIEAANAACRKLFGYAPEELLGRSLDVVLPGNHVDRPVPASSPVPWEPGTITDVRARRKDGSHFPVQLTVAAVQAGARRLFIANFHDRSERERLELQFRQAQKMDALGRLCGGVAHDFNNLLTVISGYAQLLLNGLTTSDPMHALAVEVDRTVERAAELARQLLLFSRKQVRQAAPVDLNTLVRGMERMLRRLIGETIELGTRLEPELGQVRSDAGQLEQVVLNLTVNARDAMPGGGRLLLETANVDLDAHYVHLHPEARPGPYVQLAVSDTGTGFSDEALNHLFEPFFTTKESGKGTGLGLATVYSIVTQWNGHVTVSTEPGKGTVVKVLLPRQSVAAAAPTPPPPVSAELPGGSETVLLAEDDQDLRVLIAKILTRLGYKVLEARSGDDAVHLAAVHANEPLHLLITDVVMPGLSGPDLAEKLLRTARGLRVLFISGYTGDTIFNRGLLGEGLAFLAKPFTATTLAAKVRELLDAPPRPPAPPPPG